MNIYYEQFSHLESNLHFLNRYLNLIVKFKERDLSKAKGLENHHIFPRAFGGSNKKENMVYLTLKEHFIIHHLLWKAFPGNYSMETAFYLMSHTKNHKNKITAKIFEKLKNDRSLKNSNSQKGIPQSPEHIKKRSDALKGKKQKPRSVEAIKKTADANRGKKRSSESIQKQQETRKRNHLIKLENILKTIIFLQMQTIFAPFFS